MSIRSLTVTALLFCAIPLPAASGRPTILVADFEQANLSSWVGDQETVLMDFEDAALHDESWLTSQPQGTVALVVSSKSDSGACDLSLSPGGGRNNSHALLVECADSSAGLPGFWIKKHENRGYAANFKDDVGYLLPRGRSANRAELWVRFEPGFQSTGAAAQPPAYPNHQNFHFGTYHFDPARIDGLTDVKESDNWHFYFQIHLRHDKANGDWIRVVLNEIPQHIRSESALPPNNPTRPADDFWEILTRFYFDAVPYFGDPEISYPIKMWVDDVKLLYVEETRPVEVTLNDHAWGESIEATMGQTSSFAVTVTNKTPVEVCGVLAQAAISHLDAEILEGAASISNPAQLCLPAQGARQLSLQITPSTQTADGTTRFLGLTFVTNDQFKSDLESTSRSLSDDRVERRWLDEVGPFDGVVAGDFLRVILRSQTTP